MYQINNKQLTFLDSRFYSTEDGGFVPSVTTILEAYPKGAAYYNWLKEAGKTRMKSGTKPDGADRWFTN